MPGIDVPCKCDPTKMTVVFSDIFNNSNNNFIFTLS